MTSLRIGSHASGHAPWERLVARGLLLGVPVLLGAWIGFTTLLVVLWHTA